MQSVTFTPLPVATPELSRIIESNRTPTPPPVERNRFMTMTLEQLVDRPHYGQKTDTCKQYRDAVRAKSRLAVVERTNKYKARCLERRAAKNERDAEQRGVFHTEAEVGDMTVGAGDTIEQHQNVQDIVGEVSDKTSTGVLNVSPSDHYTEHPIERFWERPITIHDSTVAVDADVDINLNIWDLWSKDQAVRAKLSNFGYINSCTLHAKISVSGTPFHYGRLMVSYQPYSQYNSFINSYKLAAGATLPSTVDVKESFDVYLSQAPGVSFMDVKENMPLEVEMPLISYKSKHALMLDTDAVISPATSFPDLEEAGELIIRTLGRAISIANEDFSAVVAIHISVWASNVELGCITGTNIDITAESGESRKSSPMYNSSLSWGVALKRTIQGAWNGDEYTQKGPVEKIATSLSGWIPSLASVPIIGKYAVATASVTGALSRISHMFGLSRPAILEDIKVTKTQVYSNGANTSGGDSTMRLSCDPKQGLSISPTYGGYQGPDDMAINTIASIESYIGNFTWSKTDVPMDTELFLALVTPTYSFPTFGSVTVANMQPTPLAFAAQPFRFWRGTIKYRFQIVCSKFHRGKLILVYEPNVVSRTNITADTLKLNQQNTLLIDIQETQEVTFCVDWVSQTPFLEVPDSGLTSGAATSYMTTLGPITTTTAHQRLANGFITVRPYNTLVQPTDLSDITINVFVSCDDLQLAAPRQENLELANENSYFYTESGETSGGVESTNITLVAHGSYNPDTMLDVMGEQVVSFRALLKRYVTYQAVTMSDFFGATGDFNLHLEAPIYPAFITAPEPVSVGPPVWPSHDGVRKTPLFRYLRGAYMGMRGGMRYRFVPTFNSSIERDTFVTVRRIAAGTEGDPELELSETTVDTEVGVASAGPDFSGGVVSSLHIGSGVEVEFPYYSEQFFVFSFSEGFGLTQKTSADGTGYNPNFENLLTVDTKLRAAVLSGTNSWRLDGCTAEDFTFLRFQGAPCYQATDVTP